MKNLTLRIDEDVLAEARKLAALKGTTVARLVREFLTALVEEGEADAAAGEQARRELVELAKRSRSGPGGWKRNREETYEERMDRFLESGTQAPGFAEAPPPYEDEAMIENAADRSPTLEEMTRDTGAPPVPGHDAWVRRQVQSTLDKKKSGKLKYSDFDEVAARFGFNAR